MGQNMGSRLELDCLARVGGWVSLMCMEDLVSSRVDGYAETCSYYNSNDRLGRRTTMKCTSVDR